MSQPPRRVVVTGQGDVSSLGMNAGEHIEGLRSGHCGIAPIELIDSEGLLIKIAAEAKGFVSIDHFTQDEITLRDRVTQMAIIAAREAYAQSGL